MADDNSLSYGYRGCAAPDTGHNSKENHPWAKRTHIWHGRYLPVEDPVRKRAHARFFKTAPELSPILTKDKLWLSYSKNFGTLEEAASELATSAPLKLGQ